MLDEYINSYFSESQKALKSMFDISVNTASCEYEIHKTFSPSSGYVIQIPFYGSILGDYFLSINKQLWQSYLLNSFDVKEECLLSSSLKEYLNVVVGEAILVLRKDFPEITYSSPRIIKLIEYPQINTIQTVYNCSELGEIGLAISIDLMKADIGLELNKALIKLKEQNEQLRHSDRLSSLGTMLATIMHELNNPAAYLSINTYILKNNFLPVFTDYVKEHGFEGYPKLAKYMQKLPQICDSYAEGIERIQKVTDSVKNYSRSQVVTQQNKVSFEEVLKKSLSLGKICLTDRITLTENISKDLPAVQCDPHIIEQVIINLLSNAAHALARVESPQINLTAKVIEETIVIDIIDNGPGIENDLVDKIWQPFFTTKSEDSGTGLGLHICKEIIESLKGSISYSQAEPNGAHFKITLPENL